MAEFKVNARGRITKGRWAGQYLTIEDDIEGAGYLIVMADDMGKNAGDVWVEKSEIDTAFAEAGWQVAWGASE